MKPEADEDFIIEVPAMWQDPEKSAARDDAYLCWARQVDKGRRSLQAVADETGIKLRTLQDWRRRYGWDQRWLNDIAGARHKLIREAEAVLLVNLRPAMERLGTIARTGSDKDAVAAIKVLASIMGIDHPVPMSVNVAMISPTLVAEAREVSKGEMKKALAEISAANVNANRSRREG